MQLAHVFLQFQWYLSSGRSLEYLYLCDFWEETSLNNSSPCLFFFFLYVWTINGAEARVGASSWCHDAQESKTSLFTHPETRKHRFLSLQVKTPESIQAVQETVLFYPLVSASCIKWCLLWWTSIGVPADVSAPPIRGSDRVADQKHNLHLLTDSLVAKGIFFSSCWNRPHMICSASEFYKKNQKPPQFYFPQLWPQTLVTTQSEP